MYKSIKTYLFIVASIVLLIYFTVNSSSKEAFKYVGTSYVSTPSQPNHSLQGHEDLAFNFSSPIYPIKAIKPEVVISHVSERTRLLLHILSLGLVYFIFINRSRQFIAFRNYCKSFSVSIPIFIFCRKLII